MPAVRPVYHGVQLSTAGRQYLCAYQKVIGSNLHGAELAGDWFSTVKKWKTCPIKMTLTQKTKI